MDEQGRETTMFQDCFVNCQGSIPAASVSYGPRTPGQHTGAFSDDDPAAGRRFAVGLSATGLNEPVNFTFRLVDVDGTERTATATLAPDPRPIPTQCVPIGSTPPGPPLTVLTTAGGCSFGPPAPVVVDPLAGVDRLATRTSRALTTYDLPADFVVESVAEGAGGRIWIAAGSSAPFRAFAGSVGAAGDLRIVADSAPDNAPVPGRFILRAGDGSVTGMAGAAGGGGYLIRLTPAGQVIRSPLAPGAPFPEIAGRGQELWGVDTRGRKGWTLVRLRTNGTVARRYPTGITGQLAGSVLGPDRAVWMGDGYGRLWRLTPGGRVVRAAVPKDLYRRFLRRGPDGALYFVDFLPRPRIGRITRDLKVTRSCRLAHGSFVDRVEATPLGVWFSLTRTPGDLYLIKATGEVVRYKRAVPGSTGMTAMAPGAKNSLLVAYTSSPRAAVHAAGHVARFTPAARGQRICRTWASDRRTAIGRRRAPSMSKPSGSRAAPPHRW
jgi:hypothetical protein